MKGSFALLSEAIGIYRKRIKLFTTLALLPYLVMIPLAVFLVLTIHVAFNLSIFSYNSLSIFVIIAGVGTFTIAGMLVQSLGQTAMVYAALHYNEQLSVKFCFQKSWKIVFAYWWVSFLTTCVTIGGFFLFFVPVIVCMVWFSLVDFVLIDERKTGMTALLQSKAYIRRYFWQVAKRYFFIIFVATVILFVPLAVISANMIILSVVTTCLLLLFITPVSTLYMSLVYKNLKSHEHESYHPSKQERSFFIFIGALGFIAIPLFMILIIMNLFTKSFIDSVSNDNLQRRTFASNQTIAEALDTDRAEDRFLLREGLHRFFQHNHAYPNNLPMLVPAYISQLPIDPITKGEYEYEVAENGADYTLCTYFETRTECVTARTTP